MTPVLDRFLKYVSFDTQSDPGTDCFPSTEKQKVFARYLVDELKDIGIADAAMDEFGYVTGTLPSNVDFDVPVFGFISHMDTSPDMPGNNIKPQVIPNYDGGDIVLNKELGIVLSPKNFPKMLMYQGKDLITTDGTTLLGADNKAGITAIVGMAEYLLEHPEVKHGTIKIGFTPDEEIGTGVDHFDVKKFGAQFAYTVDGGTIGSLEYDNFNAASAKVHINGQSVHPGSAKGKMVNAVLVAMEFQGMLPVFENPAYTEGHEGFYHLNSMKGNVEKADMSYILRDHDSAKLEKKKETFRKIAAYLNDKYGVDTIEVTIQDSYRNMKEQILNNMYIVDAAKEAIEKVGVKVISGPVRGGTDGARLSFMGLPCPNLGAGSHSAHGKYEYVCVQAMEKNIEVLTSIASRICEIHAK